MIATVNSPYPLPLSYHKPIQSQEHPRLVFRSSLLPELREKMKTETGKTILTQLKKTLNQPVTYDGYVPNVGYHAAGQCFLSLLNQNSSLANDTWQLVETAINTQYRRLFEKSPVVAGIAIAYDFCYPYWDDQHRRIVPSRKLSGASGCSTASDQTVFLFLAVRKWGIHHRSRPTAARKVPISRYRWRLR